MTTISFLGFSEPISSWTHLLAAGCSLIGFFFLYTRGHGNPIRVVSLALFTFCMVFLFSMSGVFHLLDPRGSARLVLQRLDYAGIWVMIAGTFTPIHTILFRGVWRWGVLLGVWLVAIVGLVLQVVFFKDFPEWLALTLFLGLGWVGLISMLRFSVKFRGSASIKLMVAGAVLYSLGAIIDFMRGPVLWPGIFGAHEMFHVFVMLAAFCFWWFIFEWSHYPVSNCLVVEMFIYPDGSVIASAQGEKLQVKAKNKEEGKALLQEALNKLYHKSIQPRVRLRYINEEDFALVK